MEKLITSKQAAEMLGMAAPTLRKWRMRGMGPGYIRMGTSKRSHVRYKVSVVVAWLQERTFEHSKD